MRFLLRFLSNAAALWVATRIVGGVDYAGGWLAFLGVSFVFTIVNLFVGRLVKILTCPLIILSMGLFLFVINGLMLWLTSSVAGALGLAFHVRGFWSAFWGGLVVSIVSTMLNVLVVDRSWSVGYLNTTRR